MVTGPKEKKCLRVFNEFASGFATRSLFREKSAFISHG